MDSKVYKITISEAAGLALESMLKATKEGFIGGKIKKTELTSWLITYFEENCFSQCRDDIRKTYFDRTFYLESALREIKSAKKLGKEPPDLDQVLSALVS